ncbi:MAG TPA: MGMT family protein, partial [Cellvibrionaceae bacterium]
RPGAARWAGRVLKQLPADTQLPWHRVIGAGGKLSLPPGSAGYTEQCQRLAREGIDARGRISLARYGGS